jgi:hypothetical protein
VTARTGIAATKIDIAARATIVSAAVASLIAGTLTYLVGGCYSSTDASITANVTDDGATIATTVVAAYTN